MLWQEKILKWVQENTTFLVLFLVAGVAFFGFLGGVNYWRNAKESKALEAYAQAQNDKTKLEKVIQEYEGSNVVLLALADLSGKAIQDKDWDRCIAYNEFLYTQARQPFFRVLALHGQGTCLRGKGLFLEAAKIFERASKEPGHVDPLVSRFESARSYQMAKDPKAEEYFQNLLKGKDLSPFLKDKVEEELSWHRLQKNS